LTVIKHSEYAYKQFARVETREAPRRGERAKLAAEKAHPAPVETVKADQEKTGRMDKLEAALMAQNKLMMALAGELGFKVPTEK
jgi:hypothetical protein